MDATVAYGLGFGRTLYGWKDNSKMLPVDWSQAQIHSESTGIVRGIGRPEAVPVLRHCFWADGSCIMLEPNWGTSRGPSVTLGSLLIATATSLGFGFCLDYSVENSSAAVSVCET
jgi:hypothetical protein